MQVCALTDKDVMRRVENSIRFGQPLLLEGVAETLDAALEPLLLRRTFKSAGVTCIRLGDTAVEWSDGFQLFLCSSLRNPHYLPEVAVKVCTPVH